MCAQAFNDPHIRTLTGTVFDLRGSGVFEFASTGGTTSQARLLL